MTNIIKLKLPPKGPRIEYIEPAKIIKIYGDDVFWVDREIYHVSTPKYFTYTELNNPNKFDPTWS